MSDAAHSMHVCNTYVKACIDVLKLLCICAQPKVRTPIINAHAHLHLIVFTSNGAY